MFLWLGAEKNEIAVRLTKAFSSSRVGYFTVNAAGLGGRRSAGRGDSSKRRQVVIYQRFDFTEMVKRSLGAEWRRRTSEEQKEFVRLFTDLLERAYLDQVESYSGERIQYLKEREGDY